VVYICSKEEINEYQPNLHVDGENISKVWSAECNRMLHYSITILNVAFCGLHLCLLHNVLFYNCCGSMLQKVEGIKHSVLVILTV
jgi:hypothetical protein